MPKVQLTPGHWHEAADRTSCVIDIIETMLIEHAAVDQTPELRKLVEQAQEILGEVYQIAGAKM